MHPDHAVRAALSQQSPEGPVTIVAIGKAAWSMAFASHEELGSQIRDGIVITKDGHAKGAIGSLRIREAGHPLIDERAISATDEALGLVGDLSADDTVLFLVSGGGSALFERPVAGVTLETLQEISAHLLKGGADIVEFNAIRKRLSQVKGGRFAEWAAPAQIEALILSDVLGDRLDSIASGPAAADQSTTAEVQEIARRYKLPVSEEVGRAFERETPKSLDNVHSRIVGSVSVFCEAMRLELDGKGYPVQLLTTTLQAEAREVGSVFASIAHEIKSSSRPLSAPCAILAGGETVVHLRGEGTGGRNQEMALAAAIAIEGLDDVAFLALASDGTDGPTDATGGLVDGQSAIRMRAAGIDPREALEKNDAYHALAASGDLLKSGPTGTNVNDIAVILCGAPADSAPEDSAPGKSARADTGEAGIEN